MSVIAQQEHHEGSLVQRNLVAGCTTTPDTRPIISRHPILAISGILETRVL
jgi:hypothetical protein